MTTTATNTWTAFLTSAEEGQFAEPGILVEEFVDNPDADEPSVAREVRVELPKDFGLHGVDHDDVDAYAIADAALRAVGFERHAFPGAYDTEEWTLHGGQYIPPSGRSRE